MPITFSSFEENHVKIAKLLSFETEIFKFEKSAFQVFSKNRSNVILFYIHHSGAQDDIKSLLDLR